MLNCAKCGHENTARTGSCVRCSAPLACECVACGAENPLKNRFCGACGIRLGAATSPRDSLLSAVPPRYLAERILRSKQAVEGERKQVTVLFADLKGSMELLADHDPEDARKLLDPVLEKMMEAVHRYEGTVNQVMGDGIMALFGAPLAHEDHAVRACYAAFELQAAIRQYAEEVRRARGISLQVRVGINSGEVVVRSIGSDLRMDYSAIGQTVHLAARMEQLANPGSLLLTLNTLRLVEGFVIVKPLGLVPVKGLVKPIDVFEGIGVGPQRSRLRAAAARGLTRFVGRDAELVQLVEAAGRIAEGRGEVVAIVGEAGMGKSRLIWELTHSHHTPNWLILEGSSAAHGMATPFFPVIGLLRNYFQIQERDDPDHVQEKIAGKLLALDRSLGAVLPEFLSLFELPVTDAQWDLLDPPQRRQRTLDAIARLLVRESQAQPLLVVFEDLHWIDSESRSLLDRLIESLPKARLLLLVSFRPTDSADGQGWRTLTCHSELRLDPLPGPGAAAMLEELLGDEPNLQPVQRFLVERTEGNPLFLEESVRNLAEIGVLVGARGAYRATKAADATYVPPTVQAIIAARIDRLQLDDKRLLQAAAAIGQDVPWSILRVIAEQPEEAIRGALDRLHAAGFLRETRLFPELECAFQHALTHEVAYKGLVHERRTSLHARIFEVMEGLYAHQLAEHVERLGHHAERGEVWDKALSYLRQAGQMAFARPAYREAVILFERALKALAHLAPTSALQEQSIDIRFELRSALLAIGEHERILDHLREAQTCAESLKDQQRIARTLVYQTTYLWNAGDPHGAATSGNRALVIAQELKDDALGIVGGIGVAWAYHALGEYGQAINSLRTTIAALSGERLTQSFGLAGLPAVVARTWLAWCLAIRGEFAESLAVAQEGLNIAQTADHPYSLVIGCFGVGVSHLARGEHERAIPVLERGLEMCRSFNIRTWLTGLSSALGHALTLSERKKQGIVLLVEAVNVAAAMRARFRQSQRVAWLGEALLMDGQTREAEARAQEALALACQHSEGGHEAEALRLLGEIASQFGQANAPKTREYFQRALGLASRLEMRPLVAQCHLGLGTVSEQVDDREEARHHFETAAALFQEMGMRHWPDRAEAAAGLTQ